MSVMTMGNAATEAAVLSSAYKREALRLKRLGRAEAGWAESRYRTKIAPFARAAHIARSYLLGRSYDEIEGLAYTPPDWAMVEALVSAHWTLDPRIERQQFARWLDEAKLYYSITV